MTRSTFTAVAPVPAPSPAAPAASAWALQGLLALGSRAYVYLSGFAAVFLLAAHVSPARFGLYSVYQSVLEIALIAATLGSALLFSRHAAATSAGPHVQRGDLLRTLALGLPLGLALGAAILALQGVRPTGWSAAWIAGTLAVVAFNSLRLAYSRGLGHAGLLNLESGLRSTLLAVAVTALALLAGHEGRASRDAGGAVDVPQLLAINFMGVLLIGAAILATGRAQQPPRGPARLGLDAQAGAMVYALLSFLLRKADLLVVAAFMPLAYVGAFKLAFLLAEAPSQFVQALLYTRTTTMLRAGAEDFEDAVLRPARQVLLLGLGLFALLGLLVAVAGPLLSVGPQAREILLCMAPYFLLRTYTVHHEMLLALRAPLRSLRRWALLEVLLRAAAYALVLWRFPGRPHYVFFVVCGIELAVYEWRMRRQFGRLPLAGLIPRARRAPGAAS